ncbi:MAG TPA: thiamine-phosphate kinase [Wenzhouxiangellaceae bacterium]|nr:thiamine-phosphate kinase [Wenzhouxiangellaceae bacterium]
MNEFDLIAEIKARTPTGSGVALGIGDDAAVMQPADGMQLVATTDNLVAGRHFVDSGNNGATPEEIGHLSLAVNLSDLAAMGAIPRWCLLTLTLPQADPQWLGGFLDGFLVLAAAHDCALVGGNITRGPLNIGVTALGEVPAGRFATRDGACVGQRIVVTGSLGDAAAALKLEKPLGDPLRDRLLKPEPRIAAGGELAGIADAMIDISDGLLGDLAHLIGEFGAEIRCERLPTSAALAVAVPEAPERRRLQFAGGDYELLALVTEGAELPASVGATKLTEIGRVTGSGKIECLDEYGQALEASEPGWDHFRPEHQ